MAKILIVDDSVVSRNNLKTILKQGGHEVIGEAGDGQDAYEKYLHLRPELVTMDITMPKVNGIESLKMIVGRDPRARVVMISALGQGTKILEALSSGAKHYVTKPFESGKVLDAVKETLSV